VTIQDGQELRERLGELLGGVEPRPAPVTRAVGQGRGIRLRRLISAFAGLAVVAAGVVLLPLLLQSHPVSPIAPLHYKVTVEQVGRNGPRGLIGEGTTDGRHWKVQESSSHGYATISTGPQFSAYTGPVGTGSPASLSSESAGVSDSADVIIYGTVSRNVTSIVISLPDGESLRLKPVAWSGYRWVAVVIPPRIRIVRAVAYGSGAELGYVVPFGTSELITWWRPGQASPARLTKSIGAGVVDKIAWHYTAALGPWGYCYLLAGGSDCIDGTADPAHVPAGRLISNLGCDRLGNRSLMSAPRSGFAAASLGVLTVVLKYSDGSTAAFPTVAVGRDRMFGFSVPRRVTPVRSLEYGQAGHLLGSTSWAGWRC
jgi:hypothetical protein